MALTTAERSRRYRERLGPEAVRARSKAQYAANRERRLEQARAYRERHPDRVKEAQRAHDAKRDHTVRSKRWRDANIEKRKDYYEANKNRWTANENRRRAARLNATPSWADMAKIADIYREAYELRVLGLDVHVDHVVPLRGANVCGLHVDYNLQIILREENLAKGNRHEVV